MKRLRRIYIWLRAWRWPTRGVGYPITCFAFGHDPWEEDDEGRLRCSRCSYPTRKEGGWSLEKALTRVTSS